MHSLPTALDNSLTSVSSLSLAIAHAPSTLANHSVFPHCSAKAKGERQALVGDMLADANEISQLTLRRPMDRVRGQGIRACSTQH